MCFKDTCVARISKLANVRAGVKPGGGGGGGGSGGGPWELGGVVPDAREKKGEGASIGLSGVAAERADRKKVTCIAKNGGGGGVSKSLWSEFQLCDLNSTWKG